MGSRDRLREARMVSQPSALPFHSTSPPLNSPSPLLLQQAQQGGQQQGYGNGGAQYNGGAGGGYARFDSDPAPPQQQQYRPQQQQYDPPQQQQQQQHKRYGFILRRGNNKLPFNLPAFPLPLTLAPLSIHHQVGSIQDSIKQLHQNINAVSDLHSRRLATTDDALQSASTSQLAQLSSQTSQLTNQIRNQITSLNNANKQSQPGDSDFKTRKTQIATLQNSFKRALQDYQEVEKKSRDKYRQRMERQIRIVKPDATQEEIKAAFDDSTGGQQIFSQALVQSRQSGARAAFAEVQSRNQDLKKIEETITQLAQMMQDMATLVLEQDEAVQNIETQAAQVHTDVESGLQQTQKAVKSARAARAKRWICFFIIVAILIVIAVVVAVEVTKNNNFNLQAMQFLRFAFIDKSQTLQKSTVVSSAKQALEDGTPYSLLIFPEGTLFSRLTRPKSEAFAKTSGVPTPRNVLLPRSTGLLYCLRSIVSFTPDLTLYDLTIGYPGVPSQGYAQDYYTLQSIYSRSHSPPAVHIHVRSIDLASVPALRPAPSARALSPAEIEAELTVEERGSFQEWTRQRWVEKDELMDGFYKAGAFPPGKQNAVEVRIGLKGVDFVMLAGLPLALRRGCTSSAFFASSETVVSLRFALAPQRNAMLSALPVAGLLLLSLSHHASALPATQFPFSTPPDAELKPEPFNPLNRSPLSISQIYLWVELIMNLTPLDMSGISPYHDAPGASILPPLGCNVTAAAFLIRHSSIYGNDDEFADFMSPFIDKVKASRAMHPGGITKTSPLKFLDDWESPILEEDLEELTGPGEEDAFGFGKRFRELYGPLMPPKWLGKKGHKSHKVREPFRVVTASSDRDVGTAKAWIRGAFPHWQEGDDGEGDGKFVSLVKVPNKKICPAFTKEAGKPEAQEWLETFGPPILSRLRGMAPHIDFELNDVIAMFMFCGYESVVLEKRSSRFCSTKIFEEHEFHQFAYHQDLKYHYQVGYGSNLSPYLGVGWLNASTHNLLAAYEAPHPHLSADLPPPSAPPATTHTQLLFPYFTHREEPPVALVALGLWNTSTLSSTSMDHKRQWKTSRLLPFLGHVALERVSCPAPTSSALKPREDFIRVIVNGAIQEMESCKSGPGASCPIEQFGAFVAERVERYKDFEGACKLDS
ncbi:syntaxin 1B/2/3, partial [Phenoliferia sp. Uapishka_3]